MIGMRFGVVVCSKCKHAKGVQLSSRTTKCTHCGKILHVKKLKLFYTTDSQAELRHAVGQVNAKVDDKPDLFPIFSGK
jgi:hypothetical protein